MAIQFEYNDVQRDLVLPIAYVKIVRIMVENNQLKFDAKVFTSAVARQNDKQSIVNLSFGIPFENSINLASLYNYIKTQPGFENAVDV